MRGGGTEIDPARVIADLRELDRLTGGPDGARRVAWSEEWRRARSFLADSLAELDLELERDEAGNLWAYLRGEDERALALGSHLDSVPGGGWLDGALGVMAALGALRAWVESGRRPPRTLALVDFADEEGARFGRSLLGSSALSGSLAPADVVGLRDAEGGSLAEALAENGVEAERMLGARSRCEWLAAYLELHIEQGPVLESERHAVAAVAACAGVERRRFRFRGRAAHAGTTPMEMRRDAGAAASALALAARTTPGAEGGVATVGQLELRPGVATIVPGEAAASIDLRHPEADALERMLAATRAAAAEAAEEHRCELAEEEIWRIEPIRFNPSLVAAAAEATAEAGGREEPLVSGALHDAAEVARIAPAAMLFAPSIGGVSHAADEDTAEADLAVAISAFGRLVDLALERL